MVSCSKKVFMWRPLSVLRGYIQSGEKCHTTFTMDICPVCLVLILCVGHLMRDSEFLFMGSWIECVRCLITVSWYLLYWSLPTDFTVRFTYSSIVFRVSSINRSVYHLWWRDCSSHWWCAPEPLFEYILRSITSSWCCCLLPTSEMYFWSNTFRRRACSGPANIHFLTAEGFSVNPTALPERFTRSLFCSCVWPICMLDNLSVVLRTNQLPCYSNSFWLGAGRLSMSRIWTGIHMSQYWRSSAKKHGTRTFGEFT